MLGKIQCPRFRARAVPDIDQVGRNLSAADVLDLLSHLGQHDGAVLGRFDRRYDFDALGQRRERSQYGPRLKLMHFFCPLASVGLPTLAQCIFPNASRQS